MNTQEVAAAANTDVALRVVAIGASAGGLEAVREFLQPQSRGKQTAFIVAQHLSPVRPSILRDLLSKNSPLDFVEATNGAALVPDTVFIVPPNRDVTIAGTRLHLQEPPPRVSPSPSIDLLFDSLAQNVAGRGVAVVLSGTGSDGSRGLRNVRAADGLTLVQQPNSAAFDGMPRAALALGAVDLVDTADALGARIEALGLMPSPVLGGSLPVPDTDSVMAITSLLQHSLGIDFSRYKSSTLRRQIQRRMAIGQISDISSYVSMVKRDPAEAPALGSNLLVTVTEFFRDPDAFTALARDLSAYIANNAGGQMLRLWVPGCATGEEVYTLAMLVGELLGFPHDLDRRLLIFGTDLDDSSLAVARRAQYANSDASKIPTRLRAHYTKPLDDGFQISQLIRGCTIFAHHDISSDPPFPRIDLVSCRNLLIYFTNDLQRQVFASIGFALRPEGLLLLGKAESINVGVDGFTEINADQHIYARAFRSVGAVTTPSSVRLENSERNTSANSREQVAREGRLEQQIALLEALVRFNGTAFLVLDAKRQLVQVVGDVSSFCQIPEGRIGAVDWSFLRPELQDEVRALLLLSGADGLPVFGQAVVLPGATTSVRLHVSPLMVAEIPFAVVAFLTDSLEVVDAQPTTERSALFDNELRRLEHELNTSQETLHRSLAELQTVNEELEAASEELQASSEELQASNEELQASNEELGNLNGQLRHRGEELEHLNSELENIQSALSQGMVIVDADLHIVRFTPLAVRVFAMVDTDIGKPLLAVPTTVEVPGLEEALKAVLAGEPRCSLNTRDEAPCYLVQVLPYLGRDQSRMGAIITLTDVSEMTALRVTADDALSALQGKSVLLAHQAAYDLTTGLLNRQYFSESLQRELERAVRSDDRLAIAWLDLDQFKEVNDEFGHAAGDVTLRTIADRLTAAVRSIDTVGRLGGDEFGLLLAGFEDPLELDAMLERILSAVREPIRIEERELRVSVSIGVSLFPGDALSPDGLLRAADAAMYSAKHLEGDSFAFYAPAMNAAAATRRQMRSQMADAIEQGVFAFYFQPVVDASSHQVAAVEALLRWQRDEEVIAAGDFVPFAESSGQIRALGKLCVDLLKEARATLSAAGLPELSVSINLSASQLEDRSLITALTAGSTGEGLTGVIIEVLESVFLPDHHKAFAGLQELMQHGARTAVDDFGSGYSNYRRLESLAPDFIKIDRSFLEGEQPFEARLSLIKSMVEMSHALGAVVVVEGIETVAHRELCKVAKADLLQGFEIARPMPMHQLLGWLQATESYRPDSAGA